MSTKTKNYDLYKPELSDPADVTKMNVNWDRIDEELARSGTKIVSVTSNDGITYTGELMGVSELYSGLKIVIIPNRTSSTTDVKLNLNGLGDVNVIMPVDGVSTSKMDNAAVLPTWLGEFKPVEIMYDGTVWKTDIKAPSADSLTGTVPPKNGGHGLNKVTKGSYLVGNGTDSMVEKTPQEVLTDIGGAPMYTCGTTDMEDGVTPLETGKLYFYYEG
jgi:hypothetical protein